MNPCDAPGHLCDGTRPRMKCPRWRMGLRCDCVPGPAAEVPERRDGTGSLIPGTARIEHAEAVMNPRQTHTSTARPSSQRALPRRSVMTGALLAGTAFAAACVRPTNATAAAEPT